MRSSKGFSRKNAAPFRIARPSGPSKKRAISSMPEITASACSRVMHCCAAARSACSVSCARRSPVLRAFTSSSSMKRCSAEPRSAPVSLRSWLKNAGFLRTKKLSSSPWASSVTDCFCSTAGSG